MSVYQVKKLHKNNLHVHVPGSKSITNRALLIAAIGTGTSVINGTLQSEDSGYFLKSLKQLGFHIEELSGKIIIDGTGGIIPYKKAEINVGSAGTAARFLTAMLAMSDGEYIVQASEQMSRRPMRELIEALEEIGAEFTFLKDDYSLPFVIRGLYNSDKADKSGYNIKLNIDKSSQYLSALLMTAPMLDSEVCITLTGKRMALSYVGITIKMMSDFGVEVMSNGNNYTVGCKSKYRAREYNCEPDVSAACYFYAIAAATGMTAMVYGVHTDSMQGDIRFLEVLKNMGCSVEESDEGAIVTGPKSGRLDGIDVDMSDFSDQTMTLAAIAPYAKNSVTIRNVGHIRNQESDRLAAIENELKSMGIQCETWDDGITIHPGKPTKALIETYNDHRIAMAFAVTGIISGGISINNPECSNKTFPEYFNILDDLAGI